MFKKSITRFLLAISFSAIALQAQALVIDPATTTLTTWTSVAGPSQNAIIADFDAQLSAIGSTLGTEYFKQDVGGGETGSLAASYTATLTNIGGTIVFDGGTAISCPECYLMVKDGNATPQAYLFDLGNWDGMETITLQNFWPGQGGISNVSIWGTPGQVPEPSVLALMGLGLLGLVFSRRKTLHS